MNQNPYLDVFPQSEVESLTKSGSIIPNIDEHANLLIEMSGTSLYSSSITILLANVPVNPTKVETAYEVQFTEL